MRARASFLGTVGGALCLVAAAVHARQTAPAAPVRRAFGQVLDRTGKPWPLAQVTLIGRPFPSIEAVGDLDRIDVDADAEGRFQATLRPDRGYSAWAVSLRAENPGEFRVTEVAEGVGPGLTLRLREAPRTHVRRAVRLAGREAHETAGPLRCEAVAACETRLRIPIPCDADGSFLCPPVPLACIVVRDAHGVPLVLDTRRDSGTLELPPPVRILVRAVDSRDTAIAGARVALELDDILHPLGTTDAQGACTLFLPGGFSQSRLRRSRLELRVDAPGFAEETFPGSFAANPDPQVRDLENLTFRLRPCGMVAGRLVPPPGAPLPLVQLVGNQRVVTWTDAGGSFTLRGSGPFALWTALMDPADDAAAGPRSWRRALLASGGPGQLGDLRLDELRPLTLQVRMPDGAPAERPNVLADREPTNHTRRCLRGDRLGRLSFLIDPREEHVVAAQCGEAAGVLEVPGEADAGARHLTLTLTPLLSVSGRVEDDAGTPLAGFAVAAARTEFGSPRKPLIERMVVALVASPSASTDSEGRFRLLVPFHDEDIRLSCTGRLGLDHAQAAEVIHIADRPLTDVRMRVNGRLPKK